MKVTPVIIAGGQGYRLCPLSSKASPKQFLKLTNNHSLLQNNLLRLNSFSFNAPIIK